MSYRDIMALPYIAFVLGMLDAPQIDYESKKEKLNTPQTAEEQVAALTGVF